MFDFVVQILYFFFVFVVLTNSSTFSLRKSLCPHKPIISWWGGWRNSFGHQIFKKKKVLWVRSKKFLIKTKIGWSRGKKPVKYTSNFLKEFTSLPKSFFYGLLIFWRFPLGNLLCPLEPIIGVDEETEPVLVIKYTSNF